jgi:hypothetical protein
MTFIPFPANSFTSTYNTTTNNIGGKTTLGNDLTTNSTSITLHNSSIFPNFGILECLNTASNQIEYIQYTSNDTNTNTISNLARGSFGTTPIS